MWTSNRLRLSPSTIALHAAPQAAAAAPRAAAAAASTTSTSTDMKGTWHGCSSRGMAVAVSDTLLLHLLLIVPLLCHNFEIQ